MSYIIIPKTNEELSLEQQTRKLLITQETDKYGNPYTLIQPDKWYSRGGKYHKEDGPAVEHPW